MNQSAYAIFRADESVQTIFDVYRDWPFLGIILFLGFAIYFMFRYFTKEQKETRTEYNATLTKLWDKHKAERDEMKTELKSRDDRAEAIMGELIISLKENRK